MYLYNFLLKRLECSGKHVLVGAVVAHAQHEVHQFFSARITHSNQLVTSDS